jgi:hypothetical protein
MTDESLNDAIVSAKYQEVAGETTPSYLNEKVLRMAANAAKRPQYSRFMSWTRPLAWAATIALCLAITLEVTRVPVPDEGLIAPMPEQTPQEQRMDDAAEAFEAEAPARAKSAAPQKLEQAKVPPAAVSTDKELDSNILNKRAADEPRRDIRNRQLNSLTFEVKDADVLQHVEELERLQSGTSNEQVLEEAVAGAPATADTAVQSYATPQGCPEEKRTTPETWLECISALYESGDTATAEYEAELLIEVFPDFKMP